MEDLIKEGSVLLHRPTSAYFVVVGEHPVWLESDESFRERENSVVSGRFFDPLQVKTWKISELEDGTSYNPTRPVKYIKHPHLDDPDISEIRGCRGALTVNFGDMLDKADLVLVDFMREVTAFKNPSCTTIGGSTYCWSTDEPVTLFVPSDD
jgi:hypothetical protein